MLNELDGFHATTVTRRALKGKLSLCWSCPRRELAQVLVIAPDFCMP
jgi:hypothetical protein